MSSSASALTIGLNWNGQQTAAEASELVQRSGATVYHQPLPYYGPGNWQADDNLVEEAWKRGITILPTLSKGSGPGETRFLRYGDPAWGPWGAWVREAVERYGVNGSFWNGKANPTPIIAWEVWNEPNRLEENPLVSAGQCAAEGMTYFPGAGTCYQPKAYGSFLKYTGEEIQAGSIAKTAHGTEVLFGGLYTPGGYEFMSYFEQAVSVPGVAGYFTGLAIHPYSFVSGLSEFEATVRKARNWSNEIGLGSKSIWITELGWPIGGSNNFPPNGHPVSEAEQANLLTQSFNWLKSVSGTYNIPLVAWFNIRDYNSGAAWPGYCGLWNGFGVARPAWYAFQEETGGPPSLGADPAVVHEGNSWWAFYRGADGALWQESLDNGQWVNYRIGGQVAAGTTPSVTHEGGAWWVFYQGADGALHEEALVSGGGWADYRIGGSMAWSTSPSVVHEGGAWWVFYQGADGALHEEALVSGGEWADYRIGGSMAWSTSPSVVHEGGAWWVFYQGADGSLHEESLVGGGGWVDYPIGGQMAPRTTPAVLHEGSHWWVFYQGIDGTLWQESLDNGNWVNYRIGGQMAPQTSPSATHEGGAWWVFYRGIDGALHEESVASGGEWTDYRVGGAMAWASSPAALHEGGAWWVFYHGADSALREQSLVSGGEWADYLIGGQF